MGRSIGSRTGCRARVHFDHRIKTLFVPIAKENTGSQAIEIAKNLTITQYAQICAGMIRPMLEIREPLT